MKFTVGWLKDYLEFDSSVTDLCNKLTDIGLEVEKVVDPSKFEELQITKFEKDTPSKCDKLICQVFSGNKNLQIIYGAKECKRRYFSVSSCWFDSFPGRKNQFKIGKVK